ncbi:hypothetical protein [Nitrosophilus alvini]|uniref:hypothetical protein n=1 Tax=Nitrosophilus alvini TaxID=2714855 RepID=UPI00190D2193|nr:hypothetical protein [Nitrosophilus alvini]
MKKVLTVFLFALLLSAQESNYSNILIDAYANAAKYIKKLSGIEKPDPSVMKIVKILKGSVSEEKNVEDILKKFTKYNQKEHILSPEEIKELRETIDILLRYKYPSVASASTFVFATIYIKQQKG